MADVCAIYLWGLGLAIFAWMSIEYIRGKHDLLSFRNLFLVGFVLNQCHSPADALFYDNWWGFKINDKDGVAMWCALYTTIFMIVFALSYNWGGGAKTFASKIKIPSFDPTPVQVLVFAAVLTALAALLRSGFYVLPHVVAILSYRAAVGVAAVSCGFVGWAIGRKMFNPAILSAGTALLLLNLAIANLGFSRRPLAAIFAAFIWGLYYSYWRYQRPSRVMAKLIAVSIIPIIVVAAFSSIRQSGRADRSIANIVHRMRTESDIRRGLQMLVGGSACGPTELWVFDNYPHQFEPRHLFTLRFFFMINIPREIWPDKPVTLGNQIPTFVRMEGVDLKRHSVAAGIVGYAAGEGGMYALFVYATAAALFLRFFDQIRINNVLNPFLVIPLAADMGQVLGLARGDVALFAHTLVTAVVFATLITLLIAWAIVPRGIPRPPGAYGRWLPSDTAQSRRQWVTVWAPAEWVAQQGRQA